jgi:hypothetical protein
VLAQSVWKVALPTAHAAVQATRRVSIAASARFSRFSGCGPLVVMAVMTMMMMVVSVGAVLWFERCLYRRQMGAQSTQHVPEHAVAANAQHAADHLQVGVAIADVPGEPREFVRRCRVDLEERLGLVGDAYQGAILEHETVAVVQASRKTAYGHCRSKHKCWKLAR